MRYFASNLSTHKSRPLYMLVTLLVALLGSWGTAVADHRHGGSGTCWKSGAAWHYHYTGFDDYEYTVPSDWKTEISQAAGAWNAGHDNTPNWLFRDSRYANDIIVRNRGSDSGRVATTFLYANTVTISEADTVFNSYYSHKSNAGGTTSYDVQNTMTHEFGHWVDLKDISTGGCEYVTMWWSVAKGETKKQSLATPDINGVNWQYP